MRTCCESSVFKAVDENSANPSTAERPAKQAISRSARSVNNLTPGNLMERDSLETCFRKADNCVSREILGETIIVPVCNRVGDLDSIYALDEVGTFVRCARFYRYASRQLEKRLFRLFLVTVLPSCV